MSNQSEIFIPATLWIILPKRPMHSTDVFVLLSIFTVCLSVVSSLLPLVFLPYQYDWSSAPCTGAYCSRPLVMNTAKCMLVFTAFWGVLFCTAVNCIWQHCFVQRNCNSREYTSGSPARFNSWLWNQNKCKVDANFKAAREVQNWHSKLSVHSNPDANYCVNFLTYIL